MWVPGATVTRQAADTHPQPRRTRTANDGATVSAYAPPMMGKRHPGPTATMPRPLAGAPAILGAWIGGYASNDVLGVLFFGAAAGAALQVVVEVGRFVARRAPGGLRSGWVIGGYLAGILAMYVTGLFVG